MADPSPYPGAPRWVKMFGIGAVILLVLIVIVLHGGGPRHDLPSDKAGSQAQHEGSHQ